ncbi:unnamed protein product, partial [Iphiclides podalirius]
MRLQWNGRRMEKANAVVAATVRGHRERCIRWPRGPALRVGVTFEVEVVGNRLTRGRIGHWLATQNLAIRVERQITIAMSVDTDAISAVGVKKEDTFDACASCGRG